MRSNFGKRVERSVPFIGSIMQGEGKVKSGYKEQGIKTSISSGRRKKECVIRTQWLSYIKEDLALN